MHRSLLPMLFLFLLPLLTHSLILNKPTPGTGYSGILSNGTMFVSWVAETNDPAFITLEIQNNLTLDSWEYARNVEVALGAITRQLDDVSGKNPLPSTPIPTSTPRGLTTNSAALSTRSTTSLVIGTSITSAFTSGATVTNSAAPSIQDNKKSPTGAIVGGVVGGIVLLALVAAALLVYYRRQRSRAAEPLVVPLPHDPSYSPPTEDKRGRLEEVLSEKAAAQRQRDELRTNLEARGGGGSVSGTSHAESETRLRQQVEVMSERILELERQQRDLEIYQGRLFGEETSQPPPDYSATSGNQSAA
ncbi:hypothetical protein DXG01_000703 [Tephrocybe rancida]|nr:hypothetical protein DXG01_000703 [Tephrocybe rancida]